jgi:hypothetical protein
MQDLAQRLREARDRLDLVRVSRDRLGNPDGYSCGHLLDFSTELVLFHVLSDRIDLDGCDVLRLEDITRLDLTFPRKWFYLRALELKRIAPKKPSGISLTNMRSLLQSIKENYPLVVIERERVGTGACEIGRVKGASAEVFTFQRISSEATWESKDRHYKYAEITRVGFGGEYEKTLALVAGLATRPGARAGTPAPGLPKKRGVAR